MRDMSTGLWEFSLRLYKAPNVADACLGLQEASDVDVPVLLFVAWLKQASLALSPAKTEQIIELVSDWRDEIIGPLRAIRKRLKSGPKPAPDRQSEALRNAVKAAELSAEQIELQVLETEGLSLAMISDDSNRSADQNLTLVVRYYRGSDLDEPAIMAIATIETALRDL